MTIRSIPDIIVTDLAVRDSLEAIKEVIEVMLGRRGSDVNDQVLTRGDSSDYIAKSLFNAQSIVAAALDDAPTAVTIDEDCMVGRASGDNVGNLTATQAKTVLGLDCPLSPTVCTGGEITKGSNAGTFQVAALTAWLRTSDSDEVPMAYAAKTEENNIVITDTNATYIVILNYNSGSLTISLSETMPNLTTNIPIGQVYREPDNAVHYISGGYNLHNGVARLHMRARALRALELGSGSGGSTIAYSGTNNFTMSAGSAYGGINDFPLASYNSATTTLVPVYRDGSGGYTKGTARNTIDYAHYDDGTPPLGNVGVGRYSTHWVYRHIDDDHVYVVYGRGSYKLAEAEAELEPATPDYLSTFGCLIGKIVAPQAGGSFTTIQMVTTMIFSGTSVATHNELGGLNDGDYQHLTAANATDLTDGGDTTLHDHDGITENTAARHTQGTDTALGAVGTKASPVDADKVLQRNSASADALVTSTWTQVKAFLKTYFDTLYNNYVHPNHSGDVTSAADGATTIAAKAVDAAMLADGTDGELITWDAAGAAAVVAVGTSTHVLTSNGAGAAPTFQAAAGGSVPYVKVSDVKASGAAGGTFTSGAWQTRILNTEDSDTDGICSLAGNQITLSAGTYECRISAPARVVDRHKIKLRNVTGSIDLIIGTSEETYSGNVVTTRAFLVGKFTIVASQALEVQHRCTTTKATNGFGYACSVGVNEVYAVAEFWKVG